jgi:integrase
MSASNSNGLAATSSAARPRPRPPRRGSPFPTRGSPRSSSARQDADHERAGRGWIDTGLVFTTRYGTPIEPRNFNRSFDRRIIKAKVSKITVHGARKTCGSLVAALDVHPRVAMQMLRHSKIAITMEIYTEVPSAATRAALKKLGEWLDT